MVPPLVPVAGITTLFFSVASVPLGVPANGSVAAAGLVPFGVSTVVFGALPVAEAFFARGFFGVGVTGDASGGGVLLVSTFSAAGLVADAADADEVAADVSVGAEALGFGEGVPRTDVTGGVVGRGAEVEAVPFPY